mgnify:CR=1 FL=1
MSYFNREQDKKIKNDVEVLIRRLMRDELNPDEMIELKMKLQQGSLQSLMPEYFTHLQPEQRIVETARMIKAFDKYAYQVGSDEINPASKITNRIIWRFFTTTFKLRFCNYEKT